MNWAKKLFKRFNNNLPFGVNGDFIDGKNKIEKDLVLAVLEKNKQIKPIENITNSGNVTVRDNIKEQARAFRELVQASKGVKK